MIFITSIKCLMKKSSSLFLLLICIAIGSLGQDAMKATKMRLTFARPTVTEPLGMWYQQSSDTTFWRNPVTLEQSVLVMDAKTLSNEQKELKAKLLRFFCSPKIVQYKKGGTVTLKAKRSLCKRNGIPLIYRKFAKQYYKDLNKYIARHRKSGCFDEDNLAKSFEYVWREYAGEIVE